MKLYTDASAFLKVYVEESDSDVARRAIEGALTLTASRITYAEVAARLLREPDRADPLAGFNDLWGEVDIVEVDDALCRSAARLAVSRNLRTFDALHLAAAVAVADDDLVVATWDRRLWDAAHAEGMAVLPAERP